MANNNLSSTISLAQLDPDLSTQSLAAYLSTLPRFKGFNFAGSDMQQLLNSFSINTFRLAFFLNMAISEGFIDSAQIASDIRSHAKELNYTPRSSTSAQANVTVSFTASGDSQPYIIQKGQTFSTTIKGQNFTFSIPETLIVASANNNFSFTTNIYEGVYVKDSYIYNNTTGLPQIFDITNENADTSSLVVNVFENNNQLAETFNLATSLLGLNGNSQVYFLQCSAVNGGYQVLFGDGILGYQPQNGALIILDYRLSSGTPPNNAGSFNINFDPTGRNELTSPITVTTNQIALGGAPTETIETTRFYAPRWFQIQERAIVPSDYEILLKQNFPEIFAVNAYGGETMNPPQFGKVVIAVAINNVVGLPSSKIAQYTTFLSDKQALTIVPVFAAAAFMYVGIKTTVKYNVNITTETPNLIQTNVLNAIAQYNANTLNDFDVTFYSSQFSDVIENADPSIVSQLMNISVYQKITPTATANTYFLNYQLPLLNQIAPLPLAHGNNLIKCLTSSNFYSNGVLSQLEDDGAGTVRIVSIQGGNLVTSANTGTIDYGNGIVQLSSFAVNSFVGDNLLIYVTPVSDDITVNKNVILDIEPENVQITVVPISQ